jgi:hypothetical protein
MEYFVGVVESRDDPLMIGRCRVRIFGVHTEDKTDLPTADLPWAMPVTPINSASTSGVGQSPTGIVHGAWVVGFFMDGEDRQQFMMTGTLTSIQAATILKQKTTTTTTKTSSATASAPVAAGAPVATTTTIVVQPDPAKVAAAQAEFDQIKADWNAELDKASALIQQEIAARSAGDLTTAQQLLDQSKSISDAANAKYKPLYDAKKAEIATLSQPQTITQTVPAAGVTDSKPVVNSVTGAVDPTTVRQPGGWVLGQTSKKYEVGAAGAGAINDYNNKAAGDFGGAQYGIPQFPSYLPAKMPSGKSRKNPSNSPVIQFVNSCRFSNQFAGMTPATAAFDTCWKKVAAANPIEFEEDQHAFVKRTHYDVMIGNLKRAGLDLTSFGAGVQDLVWSTAVQMGPAFTSIFTIPLKGQTRLDDVTIINLVSDYKIQNTGILFKSSSAAYQNSLATGRFPNEKRDLLKLASQYNSAAQIASTSSEKDAVIPAKPVTAIPANPDVPNSLAQAFASNSTPTITFNPKTDTDNRNLLAMTATGFSDPDGIYPLKEYDNEPDTNKLARGISAGTVAEDKSLNRATGIRTADDGAFDQPINPFNAQYPYNKVFQSEAGHVVEYDDTPGAERINIYHTSGTFTEIDAIGNMVRRVVGSDYQITDGNGYVRVEGRCHISVGGSANITVAADANIEVDGDTHLTVGNNLVAEAGGRVSISAAEAMDLRAPNIYIEADEELHITAGSKINVESQGPISAKSITSTMIDVGTNLEVNVGADWNIHAGGDANIESEGSTNVKAGGDVKVFGGSSAHLKSSGSTNLDGASMNIQAGASVQADGNSPVAAEDAEFSEAGLLDGRIDYTEDVFDDEFPIIQTDRQALAVETPEEAANGGTDTIRAALVGAGVATSSELNQAPVAQSDVPVITLPTIASPVQNTKSDPKQIAYIKTMTGIPLGFKLTPNFTLGQLSANAPAQHDRVRAQCNLTEGEIVANLYEVAVNILEPIKAAYPNMFVTSAFRDFSHNTVKSVSQHCLGLAVDMQFTGVAKSDYYKLAGALKSLLPNYDQFLLEYKSFGTGNPWIHVSFNSKGNRGQVLTMFNNKVSGAGLIKLA